MLGMVRIEHPVSSILCKLLDGPEVPSIYELS